MVSISNHEFEFDFPQARWGHGINHQNPQPSFFRGCNPYLGGLKTFIFHGHLGSNREVFLFLLVDPGPHAVFFWGGRTFHPSRWEEISFRFESSQNVTSPGF